MSWLKPMMLMVVLGAILYGVYVVLNKGPAPEPPAGVGRDWAKPPDIQLGVIDDDPSGARLKPRHGNDQMAAPDRPAGQTNYPWATSDETKRGGDRKSDGASGPGSTPITDPFGPRSATAAQSAQTAPPPPNDRSSDIAAPPFSPSPGREPGRTAPNGSDGAADNRAIAPESFSAAIQTVNSLLAENKLVEALRKLTKWRDDPQLTSADAQQLSALLSQLAGTVVYSRKHLLQPAYKIQTGDTLQSIAAQYNVPPELLAKINGIEEPNRLTPGDELKVMRGPFTAVVDLNKRELTLMVEDCYAGRFSIVGVGAMVQNVQGSFDVAEKLPTGPATASSAGPIHHWVRLGGENSAWIVGTSDPASVHPSGFNLASRDAEDVYDILSTGSRVIVRR